MKRSVGIVAFMLLLGGIALAQEIKVTQPASGVTWNIGGTYLIQWTSAGTTKPTVKIMLWQGVTNVLDIAASAPNNGSYSWTIPSTVAPGAYKVRVKTIGDALVGIGAGFTIGSASTTTPIKVARPIDPGDRAGLRLKFPALSISDVKLAPNADGFVITFGYKNSGAGPLPKGSEMPVKPSFRVLIDNRDVNQGSLFIPEFPAPPGWEVPTYHGGFIKYPPPPNFEMNWTIGNLVTVKINENAVNGMASDSQSYNLKPMALNYSYDALITGVTLDWAKEVLTVNVRIDGHIGGDLKTLMVVNDKPFGQFAKYIDISDGQRTHTITEKLDGLFRWQEYKGRLWILLKANKEAYADLRDIEHRNNEYMYSFHR